MEYNKHTAVVMASLILAALALLLILGLTGSVDQQTGDMTTEASHVWVGCSIIVLMRMISQGGKVEIGDVFMVIYGPLSLLTIIFTKTYYKVERGIKYYRGG